uniref:Uncharacterized LOC107079199 n=1 Tax=Lepisosteus oculatus TaxID=7918 RepID=W5MXH8_LEPOC|nr:PREDICTED: uncharacterized protein LOC107079199 isoform X1 [Lepisosteus oculatus]
MVFQSNTKLQLCVLLLSLQAHCLTGRSVSPGQNVSLECPLSTGEVYWYRQDSAELLLAILRSFESTSTTPFYYNGFGKHYSLETNSRLLIHNVTSHDSGMYYCARKEEDIFVFSNGTRLDVTKENISNSHSGQNTTSSDQGFSQNIWLSVSLVCSFLLNFILLILVTVLVRRSRTLNCFCAKKSEKPQATTQQQDLAYAEVQMAATQKRIKKKEIHTTYAEVQFT